MCRYVSYPIWMVVTMILAGCSADDGARLDQEGHIISLSSTIQGTRSASDPQHAQLNSNVTVGVFGMVGNSPIDNGDNSSYSVGTDGRLSTATTMKWPDGSVSIYAYAPWNGGWSFGTANTFTVASDQSTEEGYLASDLLYGLPVATNPVAPTSEAVAMQFYHQLVRLAVNVQVNSSMADGLEHATVSIKNILPSTTLNLSDGTVGSAQGDVTDILIGKSVNISAGSSATFYGIIVPQEIAADATLLTVSAGDNVWTLSFTEVLTLDGGNSYETTISVSSTQFDSQLQTLTAIAPAK